MKTEKKIVDAFNELREKYDADQLRDKIIIKLMNDVSEGTKFYVRSYYLVGATPDSPAMREP